jgi:hypothetical protein
MSNDTETDTATIRVTRRTRDLLTEQARERGVSLASLLGEIARELEAEAIWSSDRADGESGTADERAWEAILTAGIA